MIQPVLGLSPAGFDELGESAYALARRLYPICRSITGAGLRETLRIIGDVIPLELSEVPTGTPVFDWTVPKEWNIRDAYIADASGRRMVDFAASSLHVVNYSVPIHGRKTLAELQPHLFSLPEHPDWIPYRTSYYREDWGFCLSQNVRDRLKDSEYEVCIDSTLRDGSLSFGEFYIKGHSDSEFLISCHACHPSLGNDNLSGMTLAACLARHLSNLNLRYSYRFLFLPGTIGAITWLSLNREQASRIKHGLVMACVGDSGMFHYKRSRRGDAEIDRAASHILEHSARPFRLLDFSPYGYDERQYCSPGFNLAVGSLTRTPHGMYPEYHTSADNLSFISPRNLTESAYIYLSVIELLEQNRRYENLNPMCEPQLGRRGLYRMMGGYPAGNNFESALLWVLNLSDGSHSLLDIAHRSGLAFPEIRQAADALVETQLLSELPEP